MIIMSIIFIIRINIHLNKSVDTIFYQFEKHLIIIINDGNFNFLFKDTLSSVLTPFFASCLNRRDLHYEYFHNH